MLSPITLIIPTHNRHQYLRRSVSYYKDFEYPILILDSSNEAFDVSGTAKLTYIHLPGISLPEKLYIGFTTIQTQFVVMCADDDFLISSGLNTCLQYLQKNPQYTVADGAYLFYKKYDIFKHKINFNLLYKKGLNSDFNNENPLLRLEDFFKSYRTVFYGVHRTKNLKDAFYLCRHAYKNLYLNEYLTALLPIATGFCRFIPVFMGVREATSESGDKITRNLDVMFVNDKAEKELINYIECVSNAICNKTGISYEQSKKAINSILKGFSNSIHKLKRIESVQNQSFSKRVGHLLVKFPLVGLWLIKQRRSKLSNAEKSIIIKSEADISDLKKVEEKIFQFKSTC